MLPHDLQVSVTDRRCRFQVDWITGIISAAVPTPRQNTSVTVTVIAQAGPGGRLGPGPSGGLQCAPEVHRARDNWQKCQPMLHLESSLSLSCKLDSEVDKFKKFLPPSPHGNRCQRLVSCNSPLAGLAQPCCNLQVPITDRRCRFQVDRITGIISAALRRGRKLIFATIKLFIAQMVKTSILLPLLSKLS